MDEIREINSIIAKKQKWRLILALISTTVGISLYGRYIYQKGITNCQKHICEWFPDEYDAMTEKLASIVEKA